MPVFLGLVGFQQAGPKVFGIEGDICTIAAQILWENDEHS